jgi:hypothetical protein
MNKPETLLAAIGAMIFFSPDEIELTHQMGKVGESVMTIKLTNNGIKDLFKKLDENDSKETIKSPRPEIDPSR